MGTAEVLLVMAAELAATQILITKQGQALVGTQAKAPIETLMTQLAAERGRVGNTLLHTGTLLAAALAYLGKDQTARLWLHLGSLVAETMAQGYPVRGLAPAAAYLLSTQQAIHQLLEEVLILGKVAVVCMAKILGQVQVKTVTVAYKAVHMAAEAAVKVTAGPAVEALEVKVAFVLSGDRAEHSQLPLQQMLPLAGSNLETGILYELLHKDC